jgi:hypothetical protein
MERFIDLISSCESSKWYENYTSMIWFVSSLAGKRELEIYRKTRKWIWPNFTTYLLFRSRRNGLQLAKESYKDEHTRSVIRAYWLLRAYWKAGNRRDHIVSQQRAYQSRPCHSTNAGLLVFNKPGPPILILINVLFVIRTAQGHKRGKNKPRWSFHQAFSAIDYTDVKTEL